MDGLAASAGITSPPMMQSQTRTIRVFALTARTSPSYRSETNRVAQRQRLIDLLTSFAVLTAACGADTSGITTNPTPSAATSATPAAAASPTSGATPTSAPSPTSGAATTSGQADATLTLGNFGQADGPGLSVKDAIAKSGGEPLLVNGILLKAADGMIWLCPALATSGPPRCAEPRLLVKKWVQPPDDQTFVSGEGLHDVAGVRWIERMQPSAWCTAEGLTGVPGGAPGAGLAVGGPQAICLPKDRRRPGLRWPLGARSRVRNRSGGGPALIGA